ncbi:universal stress protein [Streptomyces pluripotens]|uniref:Universal stress protein n=1 Tax=Streptomyces pluripotens TaxID=1355015 RepID=A0A221NXR0_9ACTN|nr:MULTISPECIES: universal stress protein [Streptomyces]ARP70484.1 stress-inducible protein [Streptomyces pluripotens]ASN24740.1 universal stress protein [Streptomyces pluripotens]KIE25394.1 stress-inducible protein [Streptomyces sp. MUSC 125]MCH0561213.1 universal stress protein [Streptomyces sp. MUM 16J]
MSRTITVGIDGSPESRAAAEWAGREAALRGLPVRLVQVWEPVPDPVAQAPLLGAETHQHGTEGILKEAAEGLRLRHPGIEVTTEQLTGRPAEALARVAREAELLVLGSRGLGGIGGFLIGSVGLSAVAHTERPVVLVRAGEQAADEHETDAAAGAASTGDSFRPVVLGLDVGRPHDALIGFAFEAAARRNAPLRVVHGSNPPPYYVYGAALEPAVEQALEQRDAAMLTEELSPWREKFPDVEVVEEPGYGSPSVRLIDASREASLVVVGRRVREGALGAHIGSVTHAVLHHATAPVAVIAHA